MQTATKRGLKGATPEELRNWSVTKDQVGHQLKKYYQTCTTEELPPRLQAVIKKLEEELPDKIHKLEG